MNGRVRGIFLDTTPLRRDRDYRWLWSGQVVNGIGNQITRIALPYQVYVLTGSTLAIAALTLFQLVPILLFALGRRLAGRRGRPAEAADGDPGRARRLQPGPGPPGAVRRAAGLDAVLRRVLCRGLLGGRPAGPLVVDPAARPARATALGDRAQPAQLPDGLDRRAGHRRPAHRHGRAGRRVRRRPRVVHRVGRGAACDRADPAAGRGRAAGPRRHPRGARASPAAGERSSARS